MIANGRAKLCHGCDGLLVGPVDPIVVDPPDELAGGLRGGYATVAVTVLLVLLGAYRLPGHVLETALDRH